MVTKNQAREEMGRVLRSSKSARETRAQKRKFSSSEDYILALNMVIGDYDPINKQKVAV